MKPGYKPSLVIKLNAHDMDIPVEKDIDRDKPLMHNDCKETVQQYLKEKGY